MNHIYRVVANVDTQTKKYLIKAKNINNAKSNAIFILRKKYIIVQIVLVEQWLNV